MSSNDSNAISKVLGISSSSKSSDSSVQSLDISEKVSPEKLARITQPTTVTPESLARSEAAKIDAQASKTGDKVAEGTAPMLGQVAKAASSGRKSNDQPRGMVKKKTVDDVGLALANSMLMT